MATDSTTADSDRIAVMEGKICVRSRTDSACNSMSDIIIHTPTESEEDMEEDGGKSPECSLHSFLDSSEDKTEGSESTSSLKRNDSDIAGNPDEVSCEFSHLSEKEMDDSNTNGLLAKADLPDSDDNAKLDETRNPCFDAPVNSMNESEPNPRLRLFPKRDAKCTTCGYHAYGKNDQSTPKTFNEAWRSKFWSPDGHRRVPTTSLIHEAAENGFPQPTKKKTRRGKRGEAKRREMREATPDSTSSELVGSEVKNKEATKQNKIDASQEHVNLIEIILVIQSLLWLITKPILSGYTGRSTSWKVTCLAIDLNGILICGLWSILMTMRRSARFGTPCADIVHIVS